MDIAELLHTVADSIGATATARSVFGEPVTSGERTVIPVAKVRLAFGAGGGSGRQGDHPKGGGGGGGGKVWASPCGSVEISPDGTRFIYFNPPEKLLAAVGAAALLGTLFFLWRGKKE